MLLLALLAGVCVYGGFFNAGLGILLLAFLALAGMTDIHAMNGLKLWISSMVAHRRRGPLRLQRHDRLVSWLDCAGRAW